MQLEKYNSLIRGIARRYSQNAADIEDFEQIGRIATWRELEKNPDSPKGFVALTIENRIKNAVRDSHAQKRRPPGGFVSLQTPLSHDQTLEDVLGTAHNLHAKDESAAAFTKAIIEGKAIKLIHSSPVPRVVARKIIRIAVEDIAGITPQQAPEIINRQFFTDLKLYPLLWSFYNRSFVQALTDTYTEIHPWHFAKVKSGYWTGKGGMHRAKKAVAWFCEKHNIHDISDCKEIRPEQFVDDGLGGMLDGLFQWQPYLALKLLFPELQAWQRHRVPNGTFGNIDNQHAAMIDYIMSNGRPPLAHLSAEEVYDQGLRLFLTKDSLKAHGLSGLLKQYRGSTYQLMSTLYPGKILPWTLNAAKSPWKDNPKDTAGWAVRWLFDKYFHIPKEDIPRYATNTLFTRVGYWGILTNARIGFKGSAFAAVDNAYPGLYSPNDFSRHRKTVTDFGKVFVKRRKNTQKA